MLAGSNAEMTDCEWFRSVPISRWVMRRSLVWPVSMRRFVVFQSFDVEMLCLPGFDSEIVILAGFNGKVLDFEWFRCGDG